VAISPYLREIRELVGPRLLVVPSVSVLVTDAEGRFLLVRHVDSGRWGTIGGAVEPDEAPADAAVREAREEAGVGVDVGRVRAVLGGPEFRVTYPNGDVTSYVSTVFDAAIRDGTPTPDGDETVDVAWFTPNDLEAADLGPFARAVFEALDVLPRPPGPPGALLRGAVLRPAVDADHDEFFAAFSRIVESGEGFPQASPLARRDFDDYWLGHSSVVVVATVGEQLAGAYYVKPNFVGRGAHIANAGYFVLPEHRGRGIGAALVADSLDRAREAGFDAMQFNLVFASNPARALYEAFGFRPIGRIPAAIEGEDAVIYWRSLR
jgi:8-oxo-dGTP pyrophosphatase MutT (NUDIX family)/GNAT superfamily N-acetyltransferase